MKIKKKWKSISNKKYDKFIKKLPQNVDKEFYKNCYVGNKDQYTLIENIDKKELKRLKRTYKIINKNKGVFNIGKVIFVIIIVAVIVFFSLFLKDKFIKSIVVNSLESVFEAKVEIGNISSSILRGEAIVLDLKVADKDSPMKNLFEINKAAIHITIEELAKGNVHISLIECSGLSFNTNRINSGVLDLETTSNTNESQTEVNNKENDTDDPLVDLEGLVDIDFKNIIEEEKNNLNTTRKINEIKLTFDNRKIEIENQIETSKKDFLLIESDIKKLGDIKSLTNPVAITTYVTNISTLEVRLNSAKTNLSTIKNEYENDFDIIKNIPNELKDTIELDKELITSKIGLDKNSSPTGIISSLVSEYGGEKINKLYSLTIKSYNIWKKFEQYNSKNEKDNDVSRRTGTIYNFNRSFNPKLLIDQIVLSLGPESIYSGNLENLTSNNTLIDKSTNFNITIPNFEINGSLDNRKNKSIIILGLKTNMPIEIMGFDSPLNIDMLDGNLDSSIVMDFKDINNSLASIQGDINNLMISTTDNNPIINSILKNHNSMNLGGSFSIKDGRVDDVNITTNLDDILVDAVKEIATQWLLEQKDKVSEQVELYFQDVITDLGLTDYLEFIPQDLNSIDDVVSSVTSELEKSKNDAEDKLNSIIDAAKVRAAAEIAKAKAIADAEFAKAKATAEAEAAKAKAAVEAEAKKAKAAAEAEAKKAKAAAEAEAAKAIKENVPSVVEDQVKDLQKVIPKFGF